MNSKLFIADLLLPNLAVSGVSKNGSLYPSCIIFKTVSFALILFSQKLWFCFDFPLTDMYFSWLENSNSLFLRFSKLSISSILLSKELYENLPAKTVCFILLLNFRIVFTSVALVSTTHTGVCTFGRSVESEGIVKGVVEDVFEHVVWTVIKFYFCRDWRRIFNLQTGIWKWKLDALDIVFFLIALCSTCVIFCVRQNHFLWSPVHIPAQ